MPSQTLPEVHIARADNSAESDRSLIPLPPTEGRHQGRCSACTWSTSSTEDEAVHEAFRTHVCETPPSTVDQAVWKLQDRIADGALRDIESKLLAHLVLVIGVLGDADDPGQALTQWTIMRRRFTALMAEAAMAGVR